LDRFVSAKGIRAGWLHDISKYRALLRKKDALCDEKIHEYLLDHAVHRLKNIDIMNLFNGLIISGTLLALMLGGWAFVRKTVYKSYEAPNTPATILFSITFAFSAFLLELLVLEVTDALDAGCVEQKPVLSCSLEFLL